MASETQQYGTRWEDLPADEQQYGYWLAIRDRDRSGLGGHDYEVVFAAHDLVGPVVWSLGLNYGSTRHWRFLRRLELPASAADVAAQDERDMDRNGVEVPVTANLFRDVLTRMKSAVSSCPAIPDNAPTAEECLAVGEIADDLFPLPKTLRGE